MMIVLAWAVVALGVVHCLLGMVMFRKPIADAVGEGLVGKFAGVTDRRLAFWFTIFGPLLIMSGHVAVLAALDGNLPLVRVVASYLLAVSLLGALALPKSPFSATLLLSAWMIAGSYG